MQDAHAAVHSGEEETVKCALAVKTSSRVAGMERQKFYRPFNWK